ncbi:hypothetical protein ACFO25_17450 [Paenactinomyces guangxiensis]|uniref:Uncharacterized protein n=1 Tax=Paenactinomyces guangxiensis TaxID=1490290 RepID=A0A7W2A9B7_9BACL|nr:hypothetical protein [Paenactinomyces guangxiensis]MBA4494748.1 hypothetical protein [Paenactinomyces guangxiensis]MBH8591832.1 hypothetical protein [Paenactinomyces guangxiensis]
MNNNHVYQVVARTINQTLGRKAVTVDQIKSLVSQAKMIRRRQGVMGLLAFSQQIPYRLFTQEEIERLKRSPRWYELSSKMIDLMVTEGVLTPAEAGMLKRSI